MLFSKKFAISIVTFFILFCILLKNLHHTTKLQSIKEIVKTKNQYTIAKITDTTTVLPLAISFSTYLIEQNPYLYGIQLASVFVTTITCNTLKHAINKPRPDDKNDKKSFPSGHSTLAFCGFATLLATRKQIKMKNWKRKIIFFASFLFAVSTPIGRVLANRHWPTDVLCGSVLGIVGSYLVFFLIEKFRSKIMVITTNSYR